MRLEAHLQHLDRLGALLVLAAFLMRGNGDGGRQMDDAHRTVGLVEGPAARARGAVGVDAQFLVDKVDLDLALDLGSTDRRRCKA